MKKICCLAEPKERIEYIDIFRGIGILLMMAAHIGFGGAADFIIHVFHMPMFFFVSGFLYRPGSRGAGQFLIKKIKTLLVPYAAFGLLHYLLWLLCYRDRGLLEPLQHLFFINTTGLPVAGALWFLTALFITDSVYFLLDGLIKNRWILTFVIALLSVFGNLETTILPVRLPFAIGPGLVGLGFFHIGRLLHENSEKKFINRILNLRIPEWLIWSALTLVLMYRNGDVNMRTGVYANILLFWLNALLSILALWNLCKRLDAGAAKMKLPGLLLDLEKKIGKNSITYLCLNQIVLLAVSGVLGRFLSSETLLTKLLLKLLTLVLSVFLLFAADHLIRKTPLRVLLGEKDPAADGRQRNL